MSLIVATRKEPGGTEPSGISASAAGGTDAPGLGLGIHLGFVGGEDRSPPRAPAGDHGIVPRGAEGADEGYVRLIERLDAEELAFVDLPAAGGGHGDRVGAQAVHVLPHLLPVPHPDQRVPAGGDGRRAGPEAERSTVRCQLGRGRISATDQTNWSIARRPGASESGHPCGQASQEKHEPVSTWPCRRSRPASSRSYTRHPPMRRTPPLSRSPPAGQRAASGSACGSIQTFDPAPCDGRETRSR